MTITRKEYGSRINEKGRIELKGRFLLELRDNAFSGTNGEDVVKHVENFMKNVANITHDRLRVSVFPFSLTGAASKWWKDESIANVKVEWDPTNIEFESWLASKFRNHMTMDRYTKNALLDYWRSRDDEEEDGYCNTGDLLGFIQEGNSIRYEDYEWYATLEDSELKEESLNNKAILEESINIKGESSDDAWSHYSPIDEWKDYEHNTYIETDASSNQNTYNNVCQIVMDHNETQGKHGWFDEHELMGDDDDNIGDLEDYLIRKDPPYYVNEEDEKSKERRCKLLRIPYVKPPTCKSEKFEVVDTAYPNPMDTAY
ncbi:hypothetical protein Tco_0273218 [Tanacetum coccineum]